MNTAHWHMLLNHLPMVGIIVGTLILAAGFMLKDQPAIKMTALGVFVFAALMAIPSYLTGEGAEEVAENLPGVTESFIENHEDLGKIFLILAEALGGLSLITLIALRFKNKFTPILFGMILLIAAGTSIFAKQVGTSGGQVRHTEIRNGNAPASETGTGQNGEGQDDD